ncbi:MAG: ABATE domain-containing protein [Candidatus Limnocylindrales bacterium]
MNSPHPTDHGHALDLEAALDFLNTRELESGELVDHLHKPADAIAWFVDHGVLHTHGSSRWTAADLDRVRAVRDSLREVVDAVVEGRRPRRDAVETVNAALAAGVVPRLELDGSTVRIGHRHADSAVENALAILAMPIVEELASGRPDRFRTCANDTCRWTFYDGSPTGRRRWCDMKTCGNRAKAARHRERARAAHGPIAG